MALAGEYPILACLPAWGFLNNLDEWIVSTLDFNNFHQKGRDGLSRLCGYLN